MNRTDKHGSTNARNVWLNSGQDVGRQPLTQTGFVASRFRYEACRPDPQSRRIGWLCSYSPEELIIAAGFVPYRFSIGSHDAGDSKGLLSVNLCPYVRRILDTALTGRFNDLSGVVFVFSCDAMRRLADIWTLYLKNGFHYCLDVPRRSDSPAESFFVEQLRKFKSSLERQAGQRISNEAIVRAIETVNRKRKLMDQISRLRLLNPPVISGSQFNAIALCGMQTDKDQFNTEAQRFLDSFDGITVARSERPRVLLCGCVIDGGALQMFIEKCGCTIVADDICTGLRHYSGLVDTTLDPIRAIARRYLQRPGCSRMKGSGMRIRQILSRAREYRADGVIFHTLKFCDLVQADLPRLGDALQQEGIPLLHIDLEGFDAVSGQIKTRVEAFVELLEKQRRYTGP